MSRKTKIKVFKIVLAILVLTLFIGITTYLFPVMKDLSSLEGQITFKDKVESSGIIGLLSLFGLQVAQIFLIIVPGEPIEILAGIPNAPSVYAPTKNPELAKQRQKQVMKKMIKYGYLTEEEADNILHKF